MQKYKFDWSLLGDLGVGRPNLGDKVDLVMYRLLLFTVRDILDREYGDKEADRILFNAGKIAGAEFFENYVSPVSTLEEFVSKTQKLLRDKGVGILRVEESSLEKGRVVLTIDEDMDCAGLPENGFEVCIYDEGFVSSLFESFTRQPWYAKEIDCWCTGARTCRFLVSKEK